MPANAVIACYRPKSGQEADLHRLLSEHGHVLRTAGLVSDRPFVHLRSPADGTIMEIFEWTSQEAAGQAHSHPGVQAIWERAGHLADFVTIGDLQEAAKPFPHFELLTLA